MLKRKFIDIGNEFRGALKAFGIKIGTVSRVKFEAHMLDLVKAAEPLLQDQVRGMPAVRRMLRAECMSLARVGRAPPTHADGTHDRSVSVAIVTA